MTKFTEEVEVKKEETLKERVWQLECGISVLTDLVIQLIGELKKEGLSVSDNLKFDYEEE